MSLDRHILVHQGRPEMLGGIFAGHPSLFLVVGYSHEDAKRLASLLGKPTRRLSPCPINLRGGSLESLMERLCRADSRVVGAALFTGWKPDGRPNYTLAVAGSRVKPKP